MHRSLLRPAVIASIGFAVAAAAAALSLSLDRDEPPDLPPPPVVGVPPEAAVGGGPPVVDVVRVGVSGDAMIAGRASPKAEIAVFVDDVELGRAVADAAGEWVFVPGLPFAAGAWQLRLRPVDGDVPVVLVVPAPEEGNPFAFKSAPGQASRLLQSPGIGDGAPLALALVDRERDGRLYVGGKAEAEATVHLYLDNRFVGRVRADGVGAWRMALRAPRPGAHALRADQVDARGRVSSRVEQPWLAGEDVVPPAGLAVPVRAVKVGGAAWLVARRLDDGGVAYAMVYQAGRGQARDPDVIYPGQVFSGPTP